jgi:hypothetical protein
LVARVPRILLSREKRRKDEKTPTLMYKQTPSSHERKKKVAQEKQKPQEKQEETKTH